MRSSPSWLAPSWLAAALLCALPLAGLAPAASAAVRPSTPAASVPPPAHGVTGQYPVRPACPVATRAGFAACLALVRTGVASHRGLFQAGATPAGYGPADLSSAYDLPSAAAGAGQTVAIVDAFDNPDAAADLAVYRAQYGLPPCTAATGCFRKVAQDGSTNYPPPDYTGGWEFEESLDVDMVSAICPDCHILLVEATNNSIFNLGSAVDEAVKLGAKYVSNSYGAVESPAERTWDRNYYQHPGVAVTASAGDGGYGVEYPAASPDVTAVGGTTLKRAPGTSRGWTETAWGSPTSEQGTGSGCSAHEAKPAWQTDKGCPRRTVADVSADADPDTGVAVYDTYGQSGWQVVGGTSVASPLIASVYALAGRPAAGSYPASYPYADTSALNDVTHGANGSCHPAYLCTARPGYDGPTGWGTPDGVAAFRAWPHGTISGMLTNAATGAPLAGATVTVGTASATTSPSGGYVLPVPPGSYRVSAQDFDYRPKAASGVAVTQGQTVTENFALGQEPMVTVTGTVTDGSGHGWPLYAHVSVPGTPASTFTDPATGRYRLTLPAHAVYTLLAAAQYPGYERASPSVTIGASAARADIRLTTDPATCQAPGYTFDGPTERFKRRTTPAGWQVVTPTGKGKWVFDPIADLQNLTGGTGGFTYVFPYNVPSGGPIHTDLITRAVDMSAYQQPVLRFDQALFMESGMRVEIDLSVDGGHTWTAIWKHTGTNVNGPDTDTIALPSAAGQSAVQVRFQYINPSSNRDFTQFWELDNVYLGDLACTPVPGGLVTGQVTDANTGARLDGAAVTDLANPNRTVATTATPGDPTLGGGFYYLFSPAGRQRFTAALSPYRPDRTTVDVRADRVTTADLALRAGQLSVTPGSVSVTERQGQTKTVPVTFADTGQVPVTVTLHERPGTVTPPGGQAPGPQVSLQRIRGTFSPLPVTTRPGNPAASSSQAGPTAQATPWVKIPHYPVPIMDNATATDTSTGDVYSVGGWNGSVLRSGYVYSPATQTWAALPGMRDAREAPVAAFDDGKLYVVGGWSPRAVPLAALEIYDPATHTWSTGASIPKPVAGASVTVDDGKLYVIGGCDATNCGFRNVQIYDPSSNTWQAGAAYPTPIAWQACGTIQATIYCAGGVINNVQDTGGTYAYDPAAGTWSKLATMASHEWAAGYSASDGRLVVSGGVVGPAGDESITNGGAAYVPATHSWTAVPLTPTASYRGGSACGFYRIGGSDNGSGAVPVNWTEQLPSDGGCEFAGVPWLAESQTSFTLKPGQTLQVSLTMTASSHAAARPGSYATDLVITQHTPYQVPEIPVTLHVTP